MSIPSTLEVQIKLSPGEESSTALLDQDSIGMLHSSCRAIINSGVVGGKEYHVPINYESDTNVAFT